MLCWWGSCHYRCRSALAVQSGTRAFEAQGLCRETVISLTQGEPDSQLSPLKIGFLSPEIRIRLSPLHWGSIRKTCRPLRPREARSTDLAIILVTFDLLGPAAILIPHQGGFSSGCLSACQTGMPLAPKCRCHPFDVAHPPLPPCLGRMTITREEDKGVPVFSETRRHEPLFNVSFTLPLNRFPNHIICTTLVLPISYC